MPAGGPAASTAPVPESAPTVPMPVVPVPVASAPADDSALLTEDDTAAPGVLSAWLGADAGEVEAHVRTLAPEGPGVLLVCSDGLWGYLEEARALALSPPGTRRRRRPRPGAARARGRGPRQHHRPGGPVRSAARTRTRRPGEERMSDQPVFTLDIDQNKYLAAGGQEIHAILTVQATGAPMAAGPWRPPR
nr:hypothetical protein GCM10020093_000670 [Planobispora longispora]